MKRKDEVENRAKQKLTALFLKNGISTPDIAENFKTVEFQSPSAGKNVHIKKVLNTVATCQFTQSSQGWVFSYHIMYHFKNGQIIILEEIGTTNTLEEATALHDAYYEMVNQGTIDHFGKGDVKISINNN